MSDNKKVQRICFALPTKMAIHANTVLCVLSSLTALNMEIDIRILPGKSNIDQARSMICSAWYKKARDDDLFMFIDSDNIFSPMDIVELIKLDSDVACGIYCSLAGKPTCYPYNWEKFLKGDDNRLYYGATGLMLIRKPILDKVEELIKKENDNISRYYISPEDPEVIPFFKQRFIKSEVGNDVYQWLGEDYSFCHMVRKVGGTVRGHISRTIGHEVIQNLKFYPDEYKSNKWDDKTIVWLTGDSRLEWTPNDIETKGLGGSETAVVYLSRYWVKQGYKVTVFGKCSGKRYGVDFKPMTEFNSNDQFNILILWRGFGMRYLTNVRAKKILCDIHDERSVAYDELLVNTNLVDKIFFKSHFQKDQFPDEFSSKYTVHQNGVPTQILNMNTESRFHSKPPKLVYASSYERGLIEMLKWSYPIIKKAVPDVEFHIFYGWELLQERIKDELRPLLQQEGIVHHERVGQSELFEFKMESTIQFYLGCDWETDCISVKESVCAGCIPVVSNKNVFKERDYCIKVDGDPKLEETHKKGAEVVIKLLTDEEFYNESLNKVLEQKKSIQSWDEVAKAWLTYF